MSGTLVPGPNEARVLAGMAVEAWRLGRLFGTVIRKLDAGEQDRYASQMRWFLKRLQDGLGELNCKIVTPEGQPYDAGMPLTPINLSEFSAGDELVVDQVLEPAIVGPSGVIRTGTATLRKAGT
jgi:hypothetical protein